MGPRSLTACTGAATVMEFIVLAGGSTSRQRSRLVAIWRATPGGPNKAVLDSLTTISEVEAAREESSAAGATAASARIGNGMGWSRTRRLVQPNHPQGSPEGVESSEHTGAAVPPLPAPSLELDCGTLLWLPRTLQLQASC